MVEPKKVEKKVERRKRWRRLFWRILSPHPYLILIRRHAGSSAAQVKGTVGSNGCGSASMAEFKDF